MADKLVSVNDKFDFPVAVAARQAARLRDAGTPEGAAAVEGVKGVAGRFEAAEAWKNTLAPIQGLAGDYTGRNGTVGTGTDDRIAMQAMVSAGSKKAGNYAWSELSRKGVTVTIPAGNYLLSAPPKGSTVTVPEGVHVDFSQAMIFVDYPAEPTADWSAILIQNGGSINPPMYLGPSGRNAPPGIPVGSNTDRMYDGIRLLGNNNATSVVSAKGTAEIKGFRGASIRAIGTWVTRYEGAIRLSSDFGFIASNWPADNVYGYPHSAALPGIISGVRLHTDAYFNGPYFNENKAGGYLGVVTGQLGEPHALDYSRSGGHQVYFNGTIWEHFANYAFWITGGVVSMTDCAFEECGLDNQGLGWFNNVQSVSMRNPRINCTGASVTASNGVKVQPFLPTIIKVTAVQSFTWEAGYYHNTYSTAKFADNSAAVFDVLAPRVDARPFAADSPMHTPLGRALSGGFQKAMKLGGVYIWADTSGILRIKSSTPTSDKDGIAVSEQT